MSRVGRPISIGSQVGVAQTGSQVMHQWRNKASELIKREMLARRWGYGELAAALRSRGVECSAAVINRRINRGNFSAAFLLVCLEVLEYGSNADRPAATPAGSTTRRGGVG